MNKRFLGLGLTYLLSCASEKMVEHDADNDGNPEIVQIYNTTKMELERRVDWNSDGIINRIVYFDSEGRTERAETDLDDDGKIDLKENLIYDKNKLQRHEFVQDGKRYFWTPAQGLKREQHEEPVEYKCNDLEIGIVGASNTVRAIYRENFDELLARDCPGTNFYLYAKGGKGPRGQKQFLEQLLKDHPNLDYAIIDPSLNENYDDDAKAYKTNVLALAEMVKQKNQKTKVIILTNTPFKGFSFPKAYKIDPLQVQKNADDFNKDLLENKLGRADLIDYAVDTYSATEDPAGSDACGKYCVKDKIHFNTEGERAVVKAVLDTVFPP
jgi:lysophospholipase L1-like esterase